MSDQMPLIAQTRELRLFKLNAPRQPWRIYVLEGSAPEQIAMLQAMYSRSPMSIEKHVSDLAQTSTRSLDEKIRSLSETSRERILYALLGSSKASFDDLNNSVKATVVSIIEAAGRELLDGQSQQALVDSAAKMAEYYVNYGHRSIGDCGNVVLFFENVPLHMPLQIQDSALYNGQEASTRYLDMSSAYVWDPFNTDVSASIQADWMRFNREGLERMVAHLSTKHPMPEGLDKKARASHVRAIKARSFDILRGLLPIGISTNASWATNLRQAADHLRYLRTHPDRLVRDLGDDTLSALSALYPKSFSHKDRPETNTWMHGSTYANLHLIHGNPDGLGIKLRVHVPDPKRFHEMKHLLVDRPTRSDIPRHQRNLVSIEALGWIDVGSFRDLHRHRSLDIPLPLIEWTKPGTEQIESWYLEQLPSDLRTEAEALLARQFARIASLEGNAFTKQLYQPLATLVPFEARGSYGAFAYMVELRSKIDVHPTARKPVLEIASELERQLPDLPLTIDRRPDDFNPARGTQTIINTTTGRDVAEPNEG